MRKSAIRSISRCCSVAGGSGKTKELAAKLKGLGCTSALVVDRSVDETFLRAARNVVGIDVLPTIGANVYDIVRHELLVVTTAGLEGSGVSCPEMSPELLRVYLDAYVKLGMVQPPAGGRKPQPSMA